MLVAQGPRHGRGRDPPLPRGALRRIPGGELHENLHHLQTLGNQNETGESGLRQSPGSPRETGPLRAAVGAERSLTGRQSNRGN